MRSVSVSISCESESVRDEMIFGLRNKGQDLYAASVHSRLCIHSGLRLESCNTTVMGALLRAHNSSRHHHTKFHVQVPDQTQDAIIYVAVVVVFYAAIILILVGTNLRRTQRAVPNPRRFREFFRKQTVLVYDQKDKTKTVKTSHKDLHAFPAQKDDSTVASL